MPFCQWAPTAQQVSCWWRFWQESLKALAAYMPLSAWMDFMDTLYLSAQVSNSSFEAMSSWTAFMAWKVTYTKDVAWSTQKEAYRKRCLEGKPFVVNVQPGVDASVPSELMPLPGALCDAEMWPTLLLWDRLRVLPKLHVMHWGSSILDNDGSTPEKRPSRIHLFKFSKPSWAQHSCR